MTVSLLFTKVAILLALPIWHYKTAYAEDMPVSLEKLNEIIYTAIRDCSGNEDLTVIDREIQNEKAGALYLCIMEKTAKVTKEQQKSFDAVLRKKLTDVDYTLMRGSCDMFKNAYSSMHSQETARRFVQCNIRTYRQIKSYNSLINILSDTGLVIQ